MQTCKTKETNKCFYLTIDNRNKFLKECFPETYKNSLNEQNIYIEEKNNGFIIHNFGFITKLFYYNHWYVEENFDYNYPQFVKYTEEEFNENYELVEKENK